VAPLDGVRGEAGIPRGDGMPLADRCPPSALSVGMDTTRGSVLPSSAGERPPGSFSCSSGVGRSLVPLFEGRLPSRSGVEPRPDSRGTSFRGLGGMPVLLLDGRRDAGDPSARPRNDLLGPPPPSMVAAFCGLRPRASGLSSASTDCSLGGPVLNLSFERCTLPSACSGESLLPDIEFDSIA